MFTSFSTALSALNATATAIDVVGNNLANINTPGYKASVSYFRDLVTQSSGDTQVGLGVAKPITVRQFTQGAVQGSGGLLDAAIQGDGFFVVKNADGQNLYTRAGSFQVDANGTLLTHTGEHVQGWTSTGVTGTVNTSGAIGDIVVPIGAAKKPVPTSEFTLDANLNSTAAADATSAFSGTINVYDSLGGTHVVTANFQKTGANQWSYGFTIPGAEITGGTAGTPFDISGASGTLTFGTDGQLTSPAVGSPVAFDIPGLVDGAADLHVSWNPYTAGGSGRLTQFGQPSASSASSQNGSGAAQLVSVSLTDGGRIMAKYSDGQQLLAGQLAMATVRNPDSLTAVGNNNYGVGALTSPPAIGLQNEGGRGSITGGATESSTVDIAREFTQLIVLQRSYQANSRVITTVDELSQETINLKK